MSRFIIKEYFIDFCNRQHYNIYDTHFGKIYEPKIYMLHSEALKVIHFLNILCGEEYERGFQDGQMDIKGKLSDLMNLGERNSYA